MSVRAEKDPAPSRRNPVLRGGKDMQSPFPGMDPYLERPSLWPNVHQSLITYARDALAPAVRPRYWVHIGERVYLSEPPRSVYPDITLVEQPPMVRERGGAAVMDVQDAPVVIIVPNVEAREVFLELRDAGSGHVVTVIEVLSPANKTAGPGRELYLEKQEQVLRSDASLVEIDLLRRGEHTVAAPTDAQPPLPPCHYLVSVSRPENRFRFETYPVTVRQRLPRFGVPLRAGEPDVRLDLQALLDQCYQNGAYADVLDYTRDPDPPFTGEDADWVCQTAQTAHTHI